MLSYTEFLFETYGKVKADKAKTDLLLTISKRLLNEDENNFFRHLLTEGYRDRIIYAIDNDSYENLYEDIANDQALHESLLDKAKEKAKAALDKIKEKGKAAAEKMSDGTKALIKVGGNILKPLKMILQKIGEGIKKAWSTAKDLAQQAVEKASEKIREKVKHIIKDGDKKKSLLDELGNMKSMAGAGVKFVTGGFVDSMAKSGEKAATAEESFSYYSYLESAMIVQATALIESGYSLDAITEELSRYTEADIDSLMESDHGHSEGGLKIPFISALLTKIGHTPPFSYFHDLGSKAEKFANSALEKASYLISKTGGPGPFEFALMGALVGVAVGYYTETGAKTAVKGIIHALEQALHFTIPGMGIVFSIIKYTGIALAVYGVVKAVAGQGEKEDSGDDEHKDDHPDDKETEKKPEE